MLGRWRTARVLEAVEEVGVVDRVGDRVGGLRVDRRERLLPEGDHLGDGRRLVGAREEGGLRRARGREQHRADLGAVAVDFQVGTGRMPLQMQGPQAPQKPVQFTDEQILAMANYVQSVAPGPDFPDPEILDGEGDVARGAELFRINCAGCHGLAGQGLVGPSLQGVSNQLKDPALVHQIISGETPPMPSFEMEPQSMADLLAYLRTLS